MNTEPDYMKLVEEVRKVFPKAEILLTASEFTFKDGDSYTNINSPESIKFGVTFLLGIIAGYNKATEDDN